MPQTNPYGPVHYRLSFDGKRLEVLDAHNAVNEPGDDTVSNPEKLLELPTESILWDSASPPSLSQNWIADTEDGVKTESIAEAGAKGFAAPEVGWTSSSDDWTLPNSKRIQHAEEEIQTNVLPETLEKTPEFPSNVSSASLTNLTTAADDATTLNDTVQANDDAALGDDHAIQINDDEPCDEENSTTTEYVHHKIKRDIQGACRDLPHHSVEVTRLTIFVREMCEI